MSNFILPFSFFVSILSFLFAGYFVESQSFYFYTSLALFFSFLIIFFLFKKTNFFIFKVFIFILLGFFLSSARLYFLFLEKPKDHISKIMETNEVFYSIGKISDEVDERMDFKKYTISLEYSCFREIKNLILKNPYGKEKCQKTFGNILVNSKNYETYDFGDYLIIKGEIKKPAKIKDFSYGDYLLMKNIYGFLPNSKIEKNILIQKELSYGDKFFKYILEIKKKLIGKIESNYSEPYSALLSGILIGARKGIPEDIQLDFQKNGLSHITAVSGYNITLIIIFLSSVFYFLPKKILFFLLSFFIILFVIISGFSSAGIRAGIMGVLGLFALKHGKKADVLFLSLIGACLICIFNPRVLYFDIGFQLSFLALIGVIYLKDIFPEKIKNFLPNFLGIRDSFFLTIGASIGVLPVILLNFGKLSLISPISNIFISPLIPIISFFGGIGLIIPFDFLSKIFAFFCYFFLKILLAISSFFAIDFLYIDLKISGTFAFFIFAFIISFSFYKAFKSSLGKQI